MTLARQEADTNPEALKYLNRLSDMLFVLARVANANGEHDILWKPGRFTGSKGSDKTPVWDGTERRKS